MRIGEIPTGYFFEHANMDQNSKTEEDNLCLADQLSYMMWRRVPSNIETAAHACAADATWEDWGVVTALNLVVAEPITVGEAIELIGTIETINDANVQHDAYYADGGTADGDKTCHIDGGAVIGSKYAQGVKVIADASGNIKCKVDSKDHLTLKFHLEAYRYVHYNASA